jgi:ferric-dicitrate binding protein FerR (iron transport regulator)
MKEDNNNPFDHTKPRGNTEEPLHKIFEVTSGFEVPVLKTKKEVWLDLQKKIADDNKRTKPSGLTKGSKIFFYSLAASILLIIGILTLVKYSNINITVPRGEQLTISLPDKSEVILNAESNLTYSKFNWKNHRKIEFEGEAFFKITKGRKLKVNCKNGVVTVLGTSFNVFSRDEELEIKCFTGKVKVSSNNNPPVVLQKNEAVKFVSDSPGITDRYNFNSETTAGWRKGVYHFEDTSLRKVLNELERQFDVKVYSPKGDHRKYTGYFKTGDLRKALDMICIPMNLKYNIIDEKTVKIE